MTKRTEFTPEKLQATRAYYNEYSRRYRKENPGYVGLMLIGKTEYFEVGKSYAVVFQPLGE